MTDHFSNNKSHRYEGNGRGNFRGRGRGGRGRGRGGAKRQGLSEEELTVQKYMSKIKLNTPQDLEQWILDRKRNYPTDSNIQKKDEKIKARSQDLTLKGDEILKSSSTPLKRAIGLVDMDYGDTDTESDSGPEEKLLTTKSNLIIEQKNACKEDLPLNSSLDLSSKETFSKTEQLGVNSEDDLIDDDVEAPEIQPIHLKPNNLLNESSEVLEKNDLLQNEIETPGSQPIQQQLNKKQNGQKVCEHFLRGRCKNGKKCRFSHVKSGGNQPVSRPAKKNHDHGDLFSMLQTNDYKTSAIKVVQALRLFQELNLISS